MITVRAYTDTDWPFIQQIHDRARKLELKLAGLEDAFPGIRHIEVLKGNEPALALYQSLGFHIAGSKKGKMPGNETFTVKVYFLERK